MTSTQRYIAPARWRRLARSAALTFGLLTAAPALAAQPCTIEGALAAAPTGLTVAPINDLNPHLPAVPTGVLMVPATGRTPAYCLVTGSVVTNPTTGKTANFALALPSSWKNKLLFSGCAGYCGVVFQSPPDDARGGGFPPDALARGFAIVATDAGHVSNPVGFVLDGSWALTAPGAANEAAVADFFYRAVHMVADRSKQFLRSWYSASLARAYFYGCSDGGREGMVEATRYPADFDGYVVGAPSFDVPGQILAGRAAKALLKSERSFIPTELLTLVDRAVYASCDAADGVKDGLIQNPGRCPFDPNSLLCSDDYSRDCLTQDQVDTLASWLSAATDQQGRVVSYGFPVSDIYNARVPGNNLYQWTEAAGPPLDIKASDPWGPDESKQAPGWAFYDQSFRYLVFRDPNRDINNDSPVDGRGEVDDADLALLEARTEAGRGDDPRQLAPFLTSTRKLIMFHGYSDGFINPFRTVRFYEDWATLAGGYDRLQQSARLFMVPGMYHCSRGPGPNVFDALGALEQWVENGVEPERIVATKYENDDRAQRALRKMPLCIFPKRARYAGHGDVNSAANWSCPANEDLLQVGPNGARAGLDMPAR